MSVTLNLTPETERRLNEKAARTGLTLELYLQQLAEGEAYDSNKAKALENAAIHSGLSFEQMTGPLALAVEAAGVGEAEVGEFFDDVLKDVRRERRTKQGPSS